MSDRDYRRRCVAVCARACDDDGMGWLVGPSGCVAVCLLIHSHAFNTQIGARAVAAAGAAAAAGGATTAAAAGMCASIDRPGGYRGCGYNA